MQIKTPGTSAIAFESHERFDPECRGTINLPADLNKTLRDKIRETEGDVIANASIGMLMRYIAARTAGIPREEALRYLFPMPRGRSMPNRPRNVPNAPRCS